jgi:hypothetical protein
MVFLGIDLGEYLGGGNALYSMAHFPFVGCGFCFFGLDFFFFVFFFHFIFSIFFFFYLSISFFLFLFLFKVIDYVDYGITERKGQTVLR